MFEYMSCNYILLPDHVSRLISMSYTCFVDRFGVQKKPRGHETFLYKVNRVIGLKIGLNNYLLLVIFS